MRFIKSSALVLALCVAGATVSLANEEDTQASCTAAGAQVAQALAGAAQNDQARAEQKLGLQACNARFYHVGMVHYAKAMELLGIKS